MTKLALCDVRGPLADLLDKLSGENWTEWLEILKSLLRKDFSVAELVEKLGGLDGVRRFLAGGFVLKAVGLLVQVATATVTGAAKLVVKDCFRVDVSATALVNIAYLGKNFKQNFLGRVEEGVPGGTLTAYRLVCNAYDTDIIDALGGRYRVRKNQLSDLRELLIKQPNGEAGVLLANGRTNIFCVEDESGTLWVVFVYWDGGGWYVDAHSVAYPGRWFAESRVVSR